MYMGSVNLLAIVAVALGYMITGMLWYSPLMFGKMWAKLARINLAKAKMTPFHWAGCVAIAATLSYGLACMIACTGVTDMMAGIKLGLCIALFFVVPTQFSAVLWAKKPLNMFFIDAGYYVAFLTVAGGIFAVWH